MGLKLPLVHYQGRSPYGRRDALELDTLVDFLTRSRTIPEKDAGPGWSPARYLERYQYDRWNRRTDAYETVTVTAPAVHRRDEGLLALSCLVLDLDHATPNWSRLEQLDSLVVGYTTFSHRFDDPRWRLVMPLASEVPALEWPTFWYSATTWLQLDGVDAACKDASHFFYLHATPPDTDPFLPATHVLGSRPIEPDRIPRLEVPVDDRVPLLPRATRPPTQRELWRAERFFHATVTRLAQHGEGGRQVAAYGAARSLGHWVAARALDYEVAWRGCWIASVTNGVATLDDVRAAEVKRAIRMGLFKGVHDGAIDLDAPSTEHAESAGSQTDRGRQRAVQNADWAAVKARSW